VPSTCEDMNGLRSGLAASATGNVDGLEGAAACPILKVPSFLHKGPAPPEERMDRVFVQHGEEVEWLEDMVGSSAALSRTSRR
jgi:hypothetical protein